MLPLERAGTSRRSFLKLVGYGVAASSLASCTRGPVRSVVPQLAGDEDVTPGRAYHVATTCGGCSAGCGVLAKGRDGRPVKLEGNPAHPVSGGGLCAVGQAALLALYDGRRLAGPLVGGRPAEASEADEAVRAALRSARPGAVRVLTGTLTSSSTRAWVARLLERHGGRHVEYDALSVSGMLEAHERTHGLRALPRLRFDRAEVVASFGADFLGTWISPVEFTRGWRAVRRPDATPPRMSRHVQVESRMSLTGSCADTRVAVAPHELRAALSDLCAALAERAGVSVPLAASGLARPGRAAVHGLAEELWAARGRSLVVCGENDADVQVLANLANHLLGNYGTTLDLARPSLQGRGDDRAVAALAADLEAGAVDVLIVSGANPAYELPRDVAAALGEARLLVATSPEADETAALAQVVVPEPHALEAWDDAEPLPGRHSLTQPTIPPLRASRSLRASLARWLGDDREDLELLRAHFRDTVRPRAAGAPAFDAFFDRALHEGFVEVPAPAAEYSEFDLGAVRPLPAAAAGDLTLVLYPKVGMLAGRHAHNAWLQELPDPVTKVTWDNYACLAPEAAERLGLEEGDVVRVAAAGGEVELPVHLQPGQDPRVVAVALGYGRIGTERFADVGPQWLEAQPTVRPGGTVGRSAQPLLRLADGALRYEAPATLTPTGRREELAGTQRHHRLEVPAHLAPKGGEVRDAVRSATFAAWRDDPAHALPHGHAAAGSLWAEDHASPGPRFGMVIDLAACSGCSGCVVACQAENNVPVVGRDEVRRSREMHWLRIDRYWHGEGAATTAAHQPMMCQHCGNAPCETVCPVLATVHGRDGLNQQVYNRCVGTRYCANNCPYKTRRFNWFDYPREDRLGNHVLNPDVTVRSRGVMEKCSMCLQRIQEAKAEARRKGRPLSDGDVRTACEQSCPADAIVFGDLHDPESRAARLAASGRGYEVLGELNVRPGVRYLARVRNSAVEGGPAHGG